MVRLVDVLAAACSFASCRRGPCMSRLAKSMSLCQGCQPLQRRIDGHCGLLHATCDASMCTFDMVWQGHQPYCLQPPLQVNNPLCFVYKEQPLACGRYVKRAMHGTRLLSWSELRETYGRELVSLRNEARYGFLNTLFSVSEAVLYLQARPPQKLLAFQSLLSAVLMRVRSRLSSSWLLTSPRMHPKPLHHVCASFGSCMSSTYGASHTSRTSQPMRWRQASGVDRGGVAARRWWTAWTRGPSPWESWPTPTRRCGRSCPRRCTARTWRASSRCGGACFGGGANSRVSRAPRPGGVAHVLGRAGVPMISRRRAGWVSFKQDKCPAWAVFGTW